MKPSSWVVWIIALAAMAMAWPAAAKMPPPLECPACDTGAECLKLGKEAYDKKQRQEMERAADCLEKAVEKSPENGEAYAFLALAYREQILNAWLRWNPNAPKAKIVKDLKEKGKAMVYAYVIPQYQQAVWAADRAMALSPGLPEALFAKGVLEVIRQNYDIAREYIDKVLEVRPNWPQAWNQSGKLHEIEVDYEAAERDYLTALKYDPNDAVAHNNLGVLYRRLTQHGFDEAEVQYKAAIESNPNYAVALVNYGMLLLDKADRAADACSYLYQGVQLANDGYGLLGQRFSFNKAFGDICDWNTDTPIPEDIDMELFNQLQEE